MSTLKALAAMWIAALTLPTSIQAQSKPVVDDGSDETATVPYLFGRSQRDAETLARQAGLTPHFSGPDTPGATIVGQSIKAGRAAHRGMVIVLKTGKASAQAIAPRLVGLTRSAAAAAARTADLRPMFYGPDDDSATVGNQSIPAGAQVAHGTYIQLQMRTTTARMPRFVGLDLAAARALASLNRLRPQFTGPAEDGAHVVRQSPPAGEETAPGAAVLLMLIPPQQLRTPNFLRRTRAVAVGIADRTGLTLDVSGDSDTRARVFQQTPNPGQTIEPGGHVAVTLRTSAAPAASVVPSVIGLSQAEATAALRGVGLSVNIIGNDGPQAHVSAQTPLSGAVVRPGGAAQIMMSTPATGTGAPNRTTEKILSPTPKHVAIPDLSGDSRDYAAAVLTDLGLSAHFSGDLGRTAKVESQSPAAGSQVDRGTAIQIVMAAASVSHAGVLSGVIGLGALGTAGFALLRRRLRPNGDGQEEGSSAVIEDAFAAGGKETKIDPNPLFVVTFATSIDLGRPTVRRKDEPIAAARALFMPAPEANRS